MAGNYYHLQTFPEILRTVSPNDFVSIRGWFLVFGLVNKFYIWGRRNDGLNTFLELMHTRT